MTFYVASTLPYWHTACIKCNMYGRPDMLFLTCVPLIILSSVLFQVEMDRTLEKCTGVCGSTDDYVVYGTTEVEHSLHHLLYYTNIRPSPLASRQHFGRPSPPAPYHHFGHHLLHHTNTSVITSCIMPTLRSSPIASRQPFGHHLLHLAKLRSSPLASRQHFGHHTLHHTINSAITLCIMPTRLPSSPALREAAELRILLAV